MPPLANASDRGVLGNRSAVSRVLYPGRRYILNVVTSQDPRKTAKLWGNRLEVESRTGDPNDSVGVSGRGIGYVPATISPNGWTLYRPGFHGSKPHRRFASLKCPGNGEAALPADRSS